MPASATDIAAATRDVVVAAWSSSTIAARYPSSRDGLASPAEGFFDSVTDAQAMADARGALIGAERRRFAVSLQDVLWPGISTSVPSVRLIDTEQAVDATMLTARIEIDLESETTNHELFG